MHAQVVALFENPLSTASQCVAAYAELLDATILDIAQQVTPCLGP